MHSQAVSGVVAVNGGCPKRDVGETFEATRWPDMNQDRGIHPPSHIDLYRTFFNRIPIAWSWNNI